MENIAPTAPDVRGTPLDDDDAPPLTTAATIAMAINATSPAALPHSAPGGRRA